MGLTIVGSKGALSMRLNDAATPVCKLRISRFLSPLEDETLFEEVPSREKCFIAGSEPLDHSLCGSPDIPHAPFFLEANRFAASDLINSINENRHPVSNVFNARMAQEMIYGVYASTLTKTKIDFPLASRQHPLEQLL